MAQKWYAAMENGRRLLEHVALYHDSKLPAGPCGNSSSDLVLGTRRVCHNASLCSSAVIVLAVSQLLLDAVELLGPDIELWLHPLLTRR